MQYLCKIGEWTRRDIQLCQFKNYDLTYAFYSKFPSWGCQEELCKFTALIFASFHTNFPSTITSHFHNQNSSSNSVFLPVSKLYPNINSLQISSDPYSSTLFLWNAYRRCSEILSKLTYNNVNFNIKQFSSSGCSKRVPVAKRNFEDFRISPLSIHVYISFMLFILIFSFNDFSSPLILFSWWRNKISWGLLKNF